MGNNLPATDRNRGNCLYWIPDRLHTVAYDSTTQTLDRFTNAQQETLEGNELNVTAGTSWLAEGDYKNFILKGEALTQSDGDARLRFHTDGKTGYDVIFHNGPIDGSRKTGSLASLKIILGSPSKLPYGERT